ncbi:hypothetical protein COT98_02210 [Candidatus Falkowbacteria bacterium CG10_big_fil_rev_8_21_14_0_10_39_9]|uniref:Phospholipid/glycerol acyltransferase domain-containing protein n=1 Tax=Candidatus Falkowbacteria bacterium CG10_big_fil_rev_8_21_14_0_10_39_9 TaxID=1974566 RepID=A0A2M6WPQ0_9BACT|nr:MAG: hypothetical protein COT98_02210 [Candidatus Falkowbacteria bacterium CG10_big_fil_rev_8_21_14_0_10_39_9]
MKTIVKAILQYLLFWLMYLLGVYIFKIKNRIMFTGKSNLPRKTKILYISNHQTLIDSLLIGISLINCRELLLRQKNIPWNAPDRKNFLDHGFAKFFFSLLKNIPTDRNIKTKEDMKNQIDGYCQIIKRGWNLLLFFEGTRTRDGSIGKCKRGAAWTILQAKPDFIIPIRIEGISPIMPVQVGFKYGQISSGHHGQVIIGQALSFTDIISSKLSDELKVRQITKRIEEYYQ